MTGPHAATAEARAGGQRSDVANRALRLIAEGVVDRDGVAGLCTRLGRTESELDRLLRAELGATALALARTQRAQTARILIENTDLDLATIASASGFGGSRQLSEAVREVIGIPPSALRAARRGDVVNGIGSRRGAAEATTTLTLRLPYQEPLHAGALISFLAARTINGIDEVVDGVYRRGMLLPHGPAAAEISLHPDHARDAGRAGDGGRAGDAGHAHAVLHLPDVRDVAPAIARCRRLLDLDADPLAIDARLATDPALAPSVVSEPGVRVPGAVDGFEMAVRAIVGQQISVAGARTILGRLIDHCLPSPTPLSATVTDSAGATTRLRAFPTPAQVAQAPDEAFGMPAARRRTLRTLAELMASGALQLDAGADRAETEVTLLAIRGIGPWTAQYVAARALGDPDVLLPTDLGVRRGAAALGITDDPARLAEHARRWWSPWRSYATIRLWRHA